MQIAVKLSKRDVYKLTFLFCYLWQLTDHMSRFIAR